MPTFRNRDVRHFALTGVVLLALVAGSGHLDLIAVFLVVMAVLFLFRALKHVASDHVSGFHWLASGAFLSLGFGARLFPIILLSLFLAVAYHASHSWRSAFTRCGSMVGVFGVIAVACVFPLYFPNDTPVNTGDDAFRSSEDVLAITPTDVLEPPMLRTCFKPDFTLPILGGSDAVAAGEGFSAVERCNHFQARPSPGPRARLSRRENESRFPFIDLLFKTRS